MWLQSGKVDTNRRSETAKLSKYVVVVVQAVRICLYKAKIKKRFPISPRTKIDMKVPTITVSFSSILFNKNILEIGYNFSFTIYF